jgi:hypothetical protein
MNFKIAEFATENTALKERLTELEVCFAQRERMVLETANAK